MMTGSCSRACMQPGTCCRARAVPVKQGPCRSEGQGVAGRVAGQVLAAPLPVLPLWVWSRLQHLLIQPPPRQQEQPPHQACLLMVCFPALMQHPVLRPVCKHPLQDAAGCCADTQQHMTWSPQVMAHGSQGLCSCCSLGAPLLPAGHSKLAGSQVLGLQGVGLYQQSLPGLERGIL